LLYEWSATKVYKARQIIMLLLYDDDEDDCKTMTMFLQEENIRMKVKLESLQEK